MNILLTGATGYIGRRLQEKLLADDSVRLRLFVRNARKVQADLIDRVDLFEGNTLDKDSVRKGLAGIEVAYYLVHSMGSGGDYEKLDRLSAQNFRDACIENRVKKIIYLGGLGKKDTSSKHLRSRLETGEILSSRPDRIQCVWFRAGVIIGSGSASFEIIRHLVQKLPVMTTPRWVRTKTQPIGVPDVLEYLFQAKDVQVEGSVTVDIGSEKMSFKDMLLRAAGVMGLKRIIIPVPLLSPRLSSSWLKLMTPVPYPIAKALIQGLKSETTIQNDNARKYFPGILPLPYDESFRRALDEIEKKQVVSRWCDSSAQSTCDIEGRDRPEEAVTRESISADFGAVPADAVFAVVESIGGNNGWFTYDWLWRLRGFIDIVFAGPGLSRGRRDPERLRIGDGLDFWKVVDLKPGKRLLLVNQMKVPGKAWLEFSIEGSQLIVTAHFYPKGLWGRLYWIFTKPLHKLIFPDIAKGIIRKAKSS
ncbi:MAG: SDR family oxidoreductase [Candidatus Aminicenantales bacterium]